MKWNISTHKDFGESIFATNGVVEVIIPLSYGLRIAHFSLSDGKNVFFEQPADMKDLTTKDGWRVRGGHRLWIAPESMKVYYPDNEPISYEIQGDEIVLFQKEDPWIHMEKTMSLSFGEDASLRVVHKIRNTGSEKQDCSLWAISAMAPGGVQHIPLKVWNNGSAPRNLIATWFYTNLGDPRAVYTRDEICLTHLPMEERYKIGVGSPIGLVQYENNGVVFEKEFSVIEDETYPDGNVPYETFMCKHMVEMESLSTYGEILPGESKEHQEIWRIREKR